MNSLQRKSIFAILFLFLGIVSIAQPTLDINRVVFSEKNYQEKEKGKYVAVKFEGVFRNITIQSYFINVTKANFLLNYKYKGKDYQDTLHFDYRNPSLTCFYTLQPKDKLSVFLDGKVFLKAFAENKIEKNLKIEVQRIMPTLGITYENNRECNNQEVPYMVKFCKTIPSGKFKCNPTYD